MVILHIACITNDFCKGVCVAVPQHINAQRNFADVGFINVNNEHIYNIENQFTFKKKETIDCLPVPFNRPDIVIFHEVYRPAYLSIYRKLKEKNIPYVIVPHGCMSKEAQRNKRVKKLIANVLMFNKFLYSAKAIQCLSEQEKKNITFCITKFVSGNGINQPLITKDKFNTSKIVFTFIGRIDIKVKGLDLLLIAISMIQDFLRDSKASFSIIGSAVGDDTKKLKIMISKLGISDLVTVFDAIKGKEKEEMLLLSDVFILTSRTEGMPLGVIEALNYGIPCLVTQGTSVKSLVEKNDLGWGCDTNSESLAFAIKQSVLENNKWYKKSRNAMEMMQKEYRWENIAFNVIQKYNEFILNSK